jgi:RNA polymerase sigma-70 factor, ECF subfamily
VRVQSWGLCVVREYFNKYGPMVYRRALTLLGDPTEAEDATQEVFVRALTNVDKFRAEASVSTWLYRITTNYCLNQVRNRSTRKRLLEAHGPDPSNEASPFEPANIIAIRRLLANAEEREATAAVYVYIDGMRREEVAEMLGCSVRTVGNLLDRFNAWAKRELDQSGVCRSTNLECPIEETTG